MSEPYWARPRTLLVSTSKGASWIHSAEVPGEVYETAPLHTTCRVVSATSICQVETPTCWMMADT